VGRFLYALWKSGNENDLIVLHVGRQVEHCALDVRDIVGMPQSTVQDYFSGAKSVLNGSTLSDEFGGFGVRVYKIN